MDAIDKKLLKLDDKIQKIEGKQKNIFDHLIRRRVCCFNNFGICKIGKNDCHFYHSEDTCEIFVKEVFVTELTQEKYIVEHASMQKKGHCSRGNDFKFIPRHRHL